MNDNVKNILEWVLCIVIAVLLALFIKYFIATPTTVKSVSMKDTLIEGQKLVLDRTQRTFHKDLKRGDIVTFEAPSSLQLNASDLEDATKPIASFKEPQGVLASFNYYVLEVTKTSYIKRVIAFPGEHVQIQEGKVYINGEELKEEYLKSGVKTVARNTLLTDFVVPEGTLFLMGDNRPDSTDCRSFGCIPYEKIESKVWIRIWPLNLFGDVK